METRSESFRRYLSVELAERQKKNPSYSLRTFAKRLKTNPGCLSSFLNGRRPLTDRMIRRFSDELALTPDEKEKIFEDCHGRVPAKRLSASYFEILSSWYYDALLALTELKYFMNEDNWIARRLGISIFQVRIARDNLFEHGMLSVENNRICSVHKDTVNTVSLDTTAALKKLQLEANQLSRNSIEEDDITSRFHSVATFPIDASKVDEAKEYMREFVNKFVQDVGVKENLNSIYQLNVGFYRLDKDEKTEVGNV